MSGHLRCFLLLHTTFVTLLTFFIVFIATMSMKLVVERSRIMEWMSQVHLPKDPRDTRSRSRLRVSSVLEPRVVVSPSWSSVIQSKLVQSGSPPLRYSHLDWPSGVLGVVGITNTVPFSLSVQPGSSISATASSMHVSFQHPAPSSTNNSGGPESFLAALWARLWNKYGEGVYFKDVFGVNRQQLSLLLPYVKNIFASVLWTKWVLMPKRVTVEHQILSSIELTKNIQRYWTFHTSLLACLFARLSALLSLLLCLASCRLL